MKMYGKKALFWATVILISGVSSTVTYKILAKYDEGGASKLPFLEQIIRPTGSAAAGFVDFTMAAEMSVNAVVHIKSTVMSSQRRSSGDSFFDQFFGFRGNTQPQPQVGYGSGVIISSDGYIVTNNHVIDGSNDLEVTLNDNRTFQAKLVGTDPATDIALLKIAGEDLPVIKFGDSGKLMVGEWVLAVGNPFMLTSTVTAGIVSAKARSIGMGSNSRLGIESFIQTDAAVNPGNSGGALVNTKGELVGINTAIFSQTGNYAGYAFAVPSSIVSKLVDDLKQYGEVQRAVLGVSIMDIDANLAKEKHLHTMVGVYLSDVVDQGAAFLAGMRAGDVITAINGEVINKVTQLQEQLNRYRPGDTIQIALLRGSEKLSFSVTLKNFMGNTEVIKQNGIGELGATFETANAQLLAHLRVRNGVEVTSISSGLFANAGIQKGFVIVKINDVRISTPEDIAKLYRSLSQYGRTHDREPVMFIAGLYPNGRTGYFAIDLAQ